MAEVLDIKNWFIDNFKIFENSLNGESSLPIHEMRKDAISKFNEMNFPTIKDEEWKYTNISPLLKHNFNLVSEPAKLTKEEINKFLFNDLDAHLLVFVDGYFSEELSDFKRLPKGVIAGSIAKEIKNASTVVQQHLGKYADYKEQIFTSINTAFVKDGAYINIPDGIIVDYAIHVLFITSSGDDKKLNQPRNLFIAGKNSQVSVLEHYVSMEENVHFTNAVTEIFTDENAIVDHIKLQEESRKAFHIARMEVDQERTSTFYSHSVSFGGDITRNDFNARFNDEGGECTLNGLFLIEGTQLFDAHTMIDHAKPHCNSHEHYKGILDHKSRGVFNGKVMVRKDAQKTNAFQENNNIILSTDALVNTKPQLEIFADDVKCSHGATIGQLDADAMFYLNSRGIGKEAGKSILIHAFASDVVKSIKVESVRNYIEEILSKKFNP